MNNSKFANAAPSKYPDAGKTIAPPCQESILNSFLNCQKDITCQLRTLKESLQEVNGKLLGFEPEVGQSAGTRDCQEDLISRQEAQLDAMQAVVDCLAYEIGRIQSL